MKKQSWVVHTKRVWVFYTQINRSPRHRVALSNTVVCFGFLRIMGHQEIFREGVYLQARRGIGSDGHPNFSASDALGSQEFVQAALIAIQGLQESVQGPASAVGSLYRAK